MSKETGTTIDKSESQALSEVNPPPNEPLTVRKRFRNYFTSDDLTDVIDYPQYTELGYLTEMKLIRQAQAGDLNARNVVWAANIRLVYSAVNHFHVPKSLLADAVQEGIFSLRRAIEKFDLSRYGAFSTYAWHWINQGIRRFLTHQRFGQRIPSHLYADFIQLIRKLDSLPGQNERSRYLAENDDFHPKQMKSLRGLTALVFTSSLEEIRLTRANPVQPREMEFDLDLSGLGKQLLATLSERKRIVLSYRYGLLGNPVETLEEIGVRLGVTRERVRQLQVSAEDRLRRRWQHLRHLVQSKEADAEVSEAATP